MINESYIKLALEVTCRKREEMLPVRESDIKSIVGSIESLKKVKSKRPLDEAIRRRFEIGKKRMTCEQMGKRYKISHGQAAQDVQIALEKLRHPARNKPFFKLFRSYLEERLDFLEKESGGLFLNSPVSDLELPRRVHRPLKKRNIRTIGDLVEKTRRDLMRTRSIGAKLADEIERVLKDAGFDLAYDLDADLDEVWKEAEMKHNQLASP